MYKRSIATYLHRIAPQYDVITLTGPRQAGKSTLSRMVFPQHRYVSLEDLDQRTLAQEDPRGFLKIHDGNVIIDEVQRVPDLLSYVQTVVDDPQNHRQFVLTGSNHLLLLEKVTQTLAGRTVIAKLLPFSKSELEVSLHPSRSLEDLLFTGGYPRIYDKGLNPQQWLQQYYQTYVERDVRALLNIGELDLFQRFVRLCAGRVGNLVNYSSLGSDCGITHPTARAWLAVLQASFICFILPPHFRNFSKRIVKSPKLYFFDTGLLCYLLHIQNPQMLLQHPMRGAIFENWVITETLKSHYNRGVEPALYFWRDTKGHEVDLIVDQGTRLYPVEIKSSLTFHPDFVSDLTWFNLLQSGTNAGAVAGECVFAGNQSLEFKNYQIKAWREV